MTDALLADLAQRLQRIEDERAIERLIASYGPLVDAGDAEATGRLWAADGSYDVEGWLMQGREDVAAMVRSDDHQALISRGCCHFLGPAVVSVGGNEAVAVCDSILVTHDGERFAVARASANHFRLRRNESEWHIVARTTRALDGRVEGRNLLATGVSGR